MKIKKLLCLVTAATFALPLAACGNEETGETVHIYMPDGAPAIALASLMDAGYSRAEFTVVNAETIGQRVSTGAADMAIMPINAAATLYNKGVDIQILTVNTHGNLYIIGDGDGDEFELGDLVGKKLGSIGQNAVPEYTLRILLDNLKIDYEVSETAVSGKVAIRYAKDGSALLPMINKGEVDYALIAEPAATNAMNKFNKKLLCDMQEQWQELFESDYPQACLVAKKSFIESDGDYVEDFIKTLEKNDGWAAAHPDETVEAIKAHMEEGTDPSLASLNATIIKNCNIKTVRAEDCIEDCRAYFRLLTSLNTDIGTVLAELPDDDIYYKG
ncbi:MAG: ABC transporter substrate-binding protein [Clostridiales bacterium]|nr:ABC transporter substrate-binding protein [Clostridiales bacterium]